MMGDAATRIGFLVDGDPNTDLMPALYEFDDAGVRLVVPFLSHQDVRSRWWSGAAMHMDDPHRTKYQYEPPRELNYFDNSGPVGFLGCVSGDASTNLLSGAGKGTVRALFALEGAGDAENFVKLNGLRSEIDSLAYWLAYSTHHTTVTVPKAGGPPEVTTTMKAVDSLPLGRRLNLKAVATGTAPSEWSPEAAYRSRVFVETFSRTPKSWDDHLALHYAIRNLLRVASWHSINFLSHGAASLREILELKGRTYNQWREVRTASTGLTQGSWKSSDRFLFYFSDIGTAGIARWLRLVDRYERGVTPLIGLLDLKGATVDAFISQLGIALEAIGYQALIDAGKTSSAANSTSVADRISHLLGEVSGNLSFAITTFGADFAASYNSVKHANRAPVAPDVKLTHVRQGVELLRVWVALRLGVKPAVLRARR